MTVETLHPQYQAHFEDWVRLRDVYNGERAVKEKGSIYLPPTAGMVLDQASTFGSAGYLAYQSYITRAVFHDYFSEGVEMLVGLLHQKPPIIELPPRMQPLMDKATLGNESLPLFLRRINEQQLVTGRCGILADLSPTPTIGPGLPYLSLYNAESIINWDDTQENQSVTDISMAVLSEHGHIRRLEEDPFNWHSRKQYRLLIMQNGIYYQAVYNENTGFEFPAVPLLAPMVQGRTSDSIPFVFANTKDIVSDPDRSPLMGLANLCLAIYRGEADYRQALYLQSQDTLVIVGGIRNPNALPGEQDAVRTGAGSRIDVDIGGDAKYIGVSANGLPEMRMSLENDKRAAALKAGQMIQTKGPQAESGDALRTRLAAQTATLNQIADTGAGALQEILRKVAKWIGESPDSVIVKPSKEFVDFELAGDEFLKLITARTMGAPISKQSMHAVMRERGLTRMEFDDEMEVIKEEDADIPPPGALAAAGGARQQQSGNLDQQSQGQQQRNSGAE